MQISAVATRDESFLSKLVYSFHRTLIVSASRLRPGWSRPEIIIDLITLIVVFGFVNVNDKCSDWCRVVPSPALVF